MVTTVCFVVNVLGRGHNQSTVCQIFGCFLFLFRLAKFLVWELQIDKKTLFRVPFSFFFLLVFFSFSRYNIYKKVLLETKGFFCFSQQKNCKESCQESSHFCMRYFSKMKRKPVKKKKYREMFCYQFVAGMQKIRQI